MKLRIDSPGRRHFLKAGGAVAAGLLTNGAIFAEAADAPLPALPFNPKTPMAMPTRNLARRATRLASSAWEAKPPSKNQTTSTLRYPSSNARSTSA